MSGASPISKKQGSAAGFESYIDDDEILLKELLSGQCSQEVTDRFMAFLKQTMTEENYLAYQQVQQLVGSFDSLSDKGKDKRSRQLYNSMFCSTHSINISSRSVIFLDARYSQELNPKFFDKLQRALEREKELNRDKSAMLELILKFKSDDAGKYRENIAKTMYSKYLGELVSMRGDTGALLSARFGRFQDDLFEPVIKVLYQNLRNDVIVRFKVFCAQEGNPVESRMIRVAQGRLASDNEPAKKESLRSKLSRSLSSGISLRRRSRGKLKSDDEKKALEELEVKLSE